MSRPRPDWTPPARDGVSPSRVAVGNGPWPDVAAFLAARLPAVDDWPARLARGDVLDLHGQPVPAHAPCRPGAVFWYWRSLPPEPRVPFEVEVLHQDEHLVVADKPHFLPVTPGGRYLQETVLVRLKRQLGIDTLVPMHRLDLETAGVLLFTVQPATRHAYQSLLRERQVHKVYEAVAPWRADLALPFTASSRLQERPGEAFMQMAVVDGEPNAHTRIELIERLGVPPGEPQAGERAHYRLTPLTGRKHQLRAQLNALGLPIVGDRIYPVLWPMPAPGTPPDHARPLQLLAREMAFADPLSGLPRRFVSRRRLAMARQALPPG
ncbi:pseudouridine synthase [Aquincola sp. MAHUQ-54]|uniref:Pseudouridine synthase n=1 Tax=Aquincola agrisoli TaxID=3119538 RepID=A0AAW9Q562_9BURK